MHTSFTNEFSLLARNSGEKTAKIFLLRSMTVVVEYLCRVPMRTSEYGMNTFRSSSLSLLPISELFHILIKQT